MKMIKRKFKGDIGELIFYSALIALPLLQIAIFYFYVNFNSILLAFQRYDPKDGFVFLDGNMWKNFLEIWKDLTGPSSSLLKELKNSFIVWFFTTGVGTFLAIVFAYYIYKKWPLAKTFKFFLFLPSVLPSILLVGVFKFFVDNAIPGYIEAATGNYIGKMLNGDRLFPTVVFYNVWICFGAQLLIYTGAMDQIAPEVLEAGKVDGVTPIREFFSLVIPMILPTVSTFVIANVATLFTNQANLYGFFGAKLDDYDATLGYQLYFYVSDEGAGSYPKASALGILCTFIAFPLTMLVRRLLNGRGDE